MINTIVSLSEIEYEPVETEPFLLDSIRTRGIAIPVHVDRYEDHFRCTDGRRRLSCCAKLAKEDPKFERIPVLIMNDYSKAGSGYWGNTQNRH